MIGQTGINIQWETTQYLKGINPKIWMNLKIIMLSERSHTKQSTYCTVSLTESFRKCKVIYSDIKQISGYLGTGDSGDAVDRDYKGA